MAAKKRKWNHPSNVIIAVLGAILLIYVVLTPRHLHCVQPQNDRGPDPRLEQLPLKKQMVVRVT